jgi:carbon-monoxide dehydrogenase large subunit
MSVASPYPKAVPEANRYIGQRSKKLKGDLFLTGRAEYINDLELLGTVHMSVLRSPHPHARITKVDLGRVRRDPRCITALEGEEAKQHADPIPHFISAAVFGGKHNDVRILAAGKVTYRGQPVAAVVAATRGDADALLDLIEVEYELLPAVIDAADALAADAPLLYDADGWDNNIVIQIPFVEGDFAAAAASADHVLADEFYNHRYSTQPIETRGYVASWDPRAESYTFYGAAQNPHPLRWVLSSCLRVNESQIRVIAPNVGGGFGLKMPGHPEEALLCVLSRILGAPVKWIEERDETLIFGAREHHHRFEVAFNDDGKLVALKNHFVANVGSVSSCPGWGMSFLTALSFPTGYKIPVTDVLVTVVATNKAPWQAARGYGKEGTQVVMERVIELVAESLGMDSAEVRRRNFVGKDEFPYKTNSGLNIDSGDYHQALETALKMLDYDGFRPKQAAALAEGRYIGFGIAFELTPESADIPGTIVGGYDTSTVKVDPSGRVTVLTGVTTPGSGNDGGIAQIVADTLGVKLEEIQVIQGDTDICPYGFGNYSGRSMVVGGNSALLAAREIRTKLSKVASAMLEAAEDDLVFDQGTITVAGTDRSVTIKDVSYAIYTLAFATAHMVEPPLEATSVYKPGNIVHFPDEKGRIQPYPTYSNAVHVAIVEVDSETGKVELQRFGVLHDCGNMINPTFVEGQMHGAVVMGIGAALSEESKYSADGRLLADRFKTYLMSRANELPMIEIEHQVTPSPFTLLGVKGAGEAGVGGAVAAVINAVNDAIRPTGARLRRTPASPIHVLAALKEAR